jgi:hypothetical protein
LFFNLLVWPLAFDCLIDDFRKNLGDLVLVGGQAFGVADEISRGCNCGVMDNRFPSIVLVGIHGAKLALGRISTCRVPFGCGSSFSVADQEGRLETIRVQELATTFPCTAKMAGVTPWDALRLDELASSARPSHGEIVTAKFFLAVWNPGEDWKSGRFDIMEALSVWDDNHRNALLAWAKAPWLA